MHEHPSTVRSFDAKPHRSLFERLTALISPEPDNRSELLDILHDAHERKLIDADALSMIEGVFQVADLTARDIMVPRPQMDVIDIATPVEEWMPLAQKTGHSRFPVVDGDRDKMVGTLLAKDLLRYYADESFDVRQLVRPAVFIPESKRLNVLLREFRDNRNHMAIVVNEYGSVAGLITIEDVLEQIVGDIEDEFDIDKDDDNILRVRDGVHGARWRVNAMTEIDQFNESLGTDLENDAVDTVGGLVVTHLGRRAAQGRHLRHRRAALPGLARRCAPAAHPAGGKAAGAAAGRQRLRQTRMPVHAGARRHPAMARPAADCPGRRRRQCFRLRAL